MSYYSADIITTWGNEVDKAKNIVGMRFGRWTALKRVGNNDGGTAQWLCRCSCGTEKVVRGTELRYGRSASCGCLNREIVRDVLIRRNYKHGKSKTREHRIWKAMIQRCHNPNSPSYERYGARGIYVCKRWRDSFAKFLLDMGKSEKDQSIDRIDNDGVYCPSNCRWASYVQQASNTRHNRKLKHKGQKHTIAEWSRRTGIRAMTIIKRLQRGWSVNRALTTPTGRLSSIAFHA